jgi:AcrR family transcriptional regulator
MATEFTGGGDRRRSIALLWGAAGSGPGQAGRRGPKPSRSVDEVVQAAIDLADAEGLAALSIRRVAQALGLSSMSLYTYVPSKAELLDLMLDRVAAEMAEPGAAQDGWRAKLELVARERWALGQRHPWIIQVGAYRPPLGPNILAKVEATLQALDGLGLDPLDMDLIVSLIGDYVRGAVRAAIEAREVEQRSGITDEQWWATNAALLQGLMDRTRYPATVRVGEAYKAAKEAGLAPDHGFEFGLQRVLDGVEMFIARRQTFTV